MSSNFKSMIFRLTIQNDSLGTCCEKFLLGEHHRTSLRSQCWFRQWLGGVRQQAINWTNVNPDLCHHNGITRLQWVNTVSLQLQWWHLMTLNLRSSLCYIREKVALRKFWASQKSSKSFQNVPLIHWYLNKMSEIVQFAFLNILSWKRNLAFWFVFFWWNLFAGA